MEACGGRVLVREENRPTEGIEGRAPRPALTGTSQNVQHRGSPTAPSARASPDPGGGIALAVVGAVLMGLGIFASTGAAPEPVCPSGTQLVAKFSRLPRHRRLLVRGCRPGTPKVVSLSATSATAGRSRRPLRSVPWS